MWPCLGTAPCPAGPWMALGGHQDGRTLAATVRAASPASAPYPACQAPRRVGLPGTPTAPGNCPPAATEDPGADRNHRLRFAHSRSRGWGGEEGHARHTPATGAPQDARPRAGAQHRTLTLRRVASPPQAPGPQLRPQHHADTPDHVSSTFISRGPHPISAPGSC